MSRPASPAPGVFVLLRRLHEVAGDVYIPHIEEWKRKKYSLGKQNETALRRAHTAPLKLRSDQAGRERRAVREYTGTVTKQQLIDGVAGKTAKPRAEIETILDSILEAISEALHSNERVDLRGFGSFVVKDKKARQGRNPRTGETIAIAARRDAGFRPSGDLKDKLAQTVEVSGAHIGDR